MSSLSGSPGRNIPEVVELWGKQSNAALIHEMTCGGCKSIPRTTNHFVCAYGHVTCINCANEQVRCPYEDETSICRNRMIKMRVPNIFLALVEPEIEPEPEPGVSQRASVSGRTYETYGNNTLERQVNIWMREMVQRVDDITMVLPYEDLTSPCQINCGGQFTRTFQCNGSVVKAERGKDVSSTDSEAEEVQNLPEVYGLPAELESIAETETQPANNEPPESEEKNDIQAATELVNSICSNPNKSIAEVDSVINKLDQLIETKMKILEDLMRQKK